MKNDQPALPPAGAGDALIDGLAERIKYVFDFNGCGFWRTCTGCYESEDGHPNGDYPTSKVLQCVLGGGCSECGGLGAVYDPIDYEEMANAMLADDADTDEPAGAGDVGYARGVADAAKVARDQAAWERAQAAKNDAGKRTAANHMGAAQACDAVELAIRAMPARKDAAIEGGQR